MWHFPIAIPSSLGPWAVFLSVLVTQLGVPVPAAPMLILGGTMAAMGQASYPSLFVAAVGATLFADSLWFCAGRWRGRRLLNGLVRYSLSLDATLRIARSVFERYGAPILVVAKFLPGVGLISAPLLGTTAVAVPVFLLWDFTGATLWASAWLLGGTVLDHEIVHIVQWVRSSGGTLVDVFAVIFVTFLLYRWVRRIQFRHWLVGARIEPAELDAMMRSPAPPLIFDARPPAIRQQDAYRIAGAYPLDLESSDRLDPMQLNQPLVIYCVCPNEATAKRIIQRLQHKKIRHAKALKGGLDAWERLGYPVEPLPVDFDVSHYMIRPERETGTEYTVRARLPD